MPNLVKKSFTLEGHQTSIALEPEFWEELVKIAAKMEMTLPKLLSQIDKARAGRPLASALRVFCLQNFVN
jgi:predicted DNA-binding ribbon-helix-helix protein